MIELSKAKVPQSIADVGNVQLDPGIHAVGACAPRSRSAS